MDSRNFEELCIAPDHLNFLTKIWKTCAHLSSLKQILIHSGQRNRCWDKLKSVTLLHTLCPSTTVQGWSNVTLFNASQHLFLCPEWIKLYFKEDEWAHVFHIFVKNFRWSGAIHSSSKLSYVHLWCKFLDSTDLTISKEWKIYLLCIIKLF
jgi:hypothetical protein